MSIERPENMDEWAQHIAALSGQELRSKAIAANSYRFVQALQEEGVSAPDINNLFRLIAAQFVKTGQEPTSEGYVDYRRIVEEDPELNALYQTLDEDDTMARQRLTQTLAHKWGETMTDARAVSEVKLSPEATGQEMTDKMAARTPGGLYGYPKAVEAMCNAANRKVKRAAISIIKNAYQKDAKVIEFLASHRKRAKSTPARVLLEAMRESHSVFASMGIKGGHPEKTAGRTQYGLYGFRARTATLGLTACSQMREQAGLIAADLHMRKTAMHERITGFLNTHAKKARCGYSRMLVAAYPDSSMKLASEDAAPETVEDWLSYED